MLGYVLKRILWFVPTLFAVTIIGFILLANTPGDPVNLLSNGAKASGNIEEQKTFWRKKLGLDLPLFYFSITTLSEPDTLYKVYDEQQLKIIKEDLKENGGYKNYIPKIVWYGYHNQYHQWLFGGANSKGIIRGDFGISYIKKEPVISIIKDKLIWSVFFRLFLFF